ncbi:MAG: hypothetical protein ACR2MX_09230 [Cyclobacteriaceae bacterium]
MYQQATMEQSITSGLKTSQELDRPPYGFRVEWIEWDSDFRNSELQIGDLIVGVNEVSYKKGTTEASKAIGQYAEATHWEKADAKDQQTITLKVKRNQESLSITGKIQAHRFYYDANERRALGSGGPDRMVNDGFGGSWSMWYEEFVKRSSYILNSGWNRGSFNNKKELETHLGHKDRVTYLVKNYPGPFAELTLSDWTQVYENLQGKKVKITPEDLEYREIGEKRVAQAKEIAINEKENFLKQLENEVIPTFPAKDPIDDDISDVVGKIVVLPWISFRRFINDLDKSFAVAGSLQQGFYFMDLDAPEARQFFNALYRYKSQISPKVAERYQFIGQITDIPRMLSYDGRPATGVEIKLLGGSAGQDDFFVNLNRNDNGDPLYAGEESLNIFEPIELVKEASPQQVIEAMISTIKFGNLTAWASLFADWRYSDHWGTPVIDLSYHVREGSYHGDWERSRRLILEEVYDARVTEVSPVYLLTEAVPENEIPKVEEVVVFIDHVGHFDGVYRTFVNSNVRRKWTLQRLDGGPWKITDFRHL